MGRSISRRDFLKGAAAGAATLAASGVLGADWYYGTSAQVLAQNDNGDVTGVIVQNEDGTYTQFNTAPRAW